MISWPVVVSKLCPYNIKLTNVNKRNKLVYKKNFDSEVLDA